MAGRIKMYTSGWPKTQNKCCQRIGMPPPDTSKNEVPKLRSIMTSTSAIVMKGKERTIRNEVNRVIQVNTGRRIMVRPGARMLMIVTMKFREAAIEATPSNCSPMTQ